jgi:hypothetical protein
MAVVVAALPKERALKVMALDTGTLLASLADTAAAEKGLTSLNGQGSIEVSTLWCVTAAGRPRACIAHHLASTAA